ncbi:carboxypeptidase-like regulatory domain-containing protein [Rubrivirga marina]|uniref:Carboxypeptidase-like regulatory domain-containing protein n=1 Tax=Rubrivirga marina TaxID=1196024 RepID=A0A271IY55_9BACT|nr:carboxypeptidase-like regulatory domain-containing protein [Rubrivirga marina]PAP76186.1 hypothetical protein BSZ37_06880 [Rubrivirga marina]
MRLLFCSLLLAGAAGAQPATLTGTVRGGDGAPLAGANVYLSGTTRGDAADAEGRYRIEGVPPGAHRLVASLVGYEAETQEIVAEAGQEIATDFVLNGARRTVGFVRVEAPRDPRWQSQLATFEQAFLGESTLADSVRIVNPEVLEFREGVGGLQAAAAKPLAIENRALGYRLTYDLRGFALSDTEVRYDGDERFEPLEPASNAEAVRWAAARVRAYRGSLRHLLRALLGGTAEAEGFDLFLDEEADASFNADAFGRSAAGRPRPADARDVFERRRDGTGQLRFDGRLDVHYDEAEDAGYPGSRWFAETRSAPADEQRSSIELRAESVAVDADGTLAAPLDVLARGYLGFERLADLLPADYALPPRAR